MPKKKESVFLETLMFSPLNEVQSMFPVGWVLVRLDESGGMLFQGQL